MNDQDKPVIWLNPAQEAECRRYHNAVIKALGDRPTYTGLQEPDRYYVAHAGELAFKEWLDACGIAYTWTPREDGRSDAQDFIVWRANGQQMTVNAKNSHVRGAKCLMQPVKQAQAWSQDLYVGSTGIRSEGGIIQVLHGGIRKPEWVEARELRHPGDRMWPPVKVDTYLMRLENLPYLMSDLACRLRSGPGSVEAA